MTSTPETVDELIAQLSADADPARESIASELGVLQSIYGDEAVKIWKPPVRSGSQSPDRGLQGPNSNGAEPGTIRYEVTLSIEAQDEEGSSHPIILLVSLPPTYPSSAPPQLQLLSRYIGPYGVDASLFGTVLRTYISRGAVEWTPGTECVFDGLEWVKERCTEWLGERMSEKKVGEVLREDEKTRAHEEHGADGEHESHGSESARQPRPDPAVQAEMPPGITIVEAEPIQDRKSAFVGRACRISDPSQVPVILAHLMSDRKIARAAHPVINAWRCRVGNVLHQDNDDDGETAAGGRLAHLLQILEVENVLVIVTRYFGGIHLGPDRFKHINQAARNALELGGFLDVPDDTHGGRRQGKARSSAKR
ncbi:ribosomal protein S5 domain 2-type protein [Earliella scabrosa]|nr:ribosomal protein S5 domain 2-type protein [Earliella scabrosa]